MLNNLLNTIVSNSAQNAVKSAASAISTKVLEGSKVQSIFEADGNKPDFSILKKIKDEYNSLSPFERAYYDLEKEYGIEAKNPDDYTGEPDEIYQDENGYNVKKYINEDGSYTLVKEAPNSENGYDYIFNNPKEGLPVSSVVEEYDAQGNITQKTETELAHTKVTLYNEDGSIKTTADVQLAPIRRTLFDDGLCPIVRITEFQDDNSAKVVQRRYLNGIGWINGRDTYYKEQVYEYDASFGAWLREQESYFKPLEEFAKKQEEKEAA